MRFYRRFEGASWWVDFWHGGRRFRKSTGTADREAAQEYAERFKADLWRLDRVGERPAVAWDTAVIDWLEHNGDLASLSDRKDQLRWASKHFAGRRLDSIDRSALDTVAKKKASEGAAPATVNRHLAAISAVLHHAHANGWLDALPAIPRRREPSTRTVWATEDQARKLLDALPEHWRAMAEFSLATGLRRANVTHLRWTEVDARRKVAWVHADEAKGARTISVPLSPAALDVLAAQKGKHKVYVFPGESKTPVSRIEHKVWTAACKKAGLKAFRWHDLRHTWASWHVQRGTPLPVLQQLGGWRSYAMVLRYAHLAPSHVAAYAGNAGLVRNRSRSANDGRPKRAA